MVAEMKCIYVKSKEKMR